jgi:hypothetical protein
MRRRPIIRNGLEPRCRITTDFDGPSDDGPGNVELVRARRDAGVAQPDDALLVRGDLGAVMIVWFELVRLDMSVNERLWVIGVRLVQVLPGQRGGTDEPRHKGESHGGAPEPGRHASMLTQKSGTCQRQAHCGCSRRLVN